MWSDAEFDGIVDGISVLGWSILKSFSATYTTTQTLAAFSALSVEEFNHLRTLHFLRMEIVRIFLAVDLPNFLRAMPLDSRMVLEESRSYPRGRIDWQRTTIARNQRGGDRGIFVTSPPQRTANSISAQLVFYVVSQLLAMSERVLREKIPHVVREVIESHRLVARRGLAALTSRGVSFTKAFGQRDANRLRSGKSVAVSRAAEVYDLINQIVTGANEQLISEILARSLLVPENLDDLFEIWALLNLVHSYIDKGWIIRAARLTGGLHSPKLPKFTLNREQASIEIYYQTVPEAMQAVSKYKDVFEDYDLRSAVRRPDITVVVCENGIQRHHILEVKRTSDPRYITDSVYKTLGYLADFDDAISQRLPRAALLVWGGVSKQPGATSKTVEILTAANFRTQTLFP